MTASAATPRERPLPASPPSATIPLVVFAVLTLAAGVAAVLAYGATAADLRRQRLRELESIAALKLEELERWRSERAADAELVASGLLPSVAVASSRHEAGLAVEARLLDWFEHLRHAGDYSALALVGADGRMGASSGLPGELPDPALLDAARAALRQDDVVMTDVHRVGLTGPLHLEVAAPLDASGGRPPGAVVLRVDPYPYLFRLLQSWPWPSKTGETLLVWRDGDRVRFANELRHWEDDPFALSVPLERRDDPAARAVAGATGATEGTDYRGRRVLAATAQVPDTPWALVVKIDREESDEPLRERAAGIAMAALGLVAASGAGLMLWWRRQQAIVDRRAEAALRTSEEKFRAAFEQAALGIALVGLDGRLLETNRAFRRMLRLEEQDPRGRLVAELVQPDQAAASSKAVRDLLDGREASSEAPLRLRRADGSQVETVVRARPVHGPAGDVQYLLAVIEDVTDRKRMEAQLLVSDRMASVGTLAAGVAHEINNPLSYVLANVDHVTDELRREGGHPDLVEALEEARAGGGRVREIVRDLKMFSRPQGGDRCLVDVRDVLRSAVSMANNEIRHRARLELELGEVPQVAGSERRLGQVFLNLLVNAAQAIPEGHAGQNVIRAVTRTAPGGAVEVEISDTGAGIDAAILDRIFDPFFTTKPVGVGTGLGLAICHGIVTDLGGEVRARSEVGRGTTFLVTLPAAPPGLAPRPASPPRLASGRAGRILVVDDEPLVGRAVARILSPPHDVVAVASARAALDRIDGGDGAFDLVLCDVMMPEMTGMELHARLAVRAPDLAARMVFVTGGAFTASARDFLERVANARIEKPVDAAALRDLVSALLPR